MCSKQDVPLIVAVVEVFTEFWPLHRWWLEQEDDLRLQWWALVVEVSSWQLPGCALSSFSALCAFCPSLSVASALPCRIQVLLAQGSSRPGLGCHTHTFTRAAMERTRGNAMLMLWFLGAEAWRSSFRWGGIVCKPSWGKGSHHGKPSWLHSGNVIPCKMTNGLFPIAGGCQNSRCGRHEAV